MAANPSAFRRSSSPPICSPRSVSRFTGGTDSRSTDDKVSAAPSPSSASRCGAGGIRRIRGAIGRQIRLDNQPYTIIGVMPPRFSFPRPERVMDRDGAGAWRRRQRVPRRLRHRTSQRRRHARSRERRAGLSRVSRSGIAHRSIRYRAFASKLRRRQRGAHDHRRADGRHLPAAAHRVRERRQPAARARRRPPPRDGASGRARRQSRPHHAPVAARIGPARGGRGRRRAAARLVRHRVGARRGAADRPDGAVLHAVGDGCADVRLGIRHRAPHRPRVRARAGVRGHRAPAADAAARGVRCRSKPCAAAHAQRADRGADCAGA